MKVLVAPDKFKRSLSALAAAEAIARGWRAVFPDAELELAPIADGGEGFAAALQAALGGEWIACRAHDPLGRDQDARYLWIEARKLAVIEMSEASGYARLKPEERDPLRATTYGTGQLLRAAVERGAVTILVGLGGSATTDGGIGLATALGYETLTTDGEELEPIPGNLSSLTRIRTEHALELPTIIAACDVTNPLLGPRGTARVFSPQKGADARTVEQLEICLESLADAVTADLGCDFRETPGAGAAGGLGFGLLSFCGAQICSGFAVFAEHARLEERVAQCDLVITGEGRIDDQTLDGKGPAGVAALARKCGKPVLALAGSIADDPRVEALFDATFSILDRPTTLEVALAEGAALLERAARRSARCVRLGRMS